MTCTVRIASPLHSYTAGASRVDGRGATLAEVLGDLERRFPGIRFRMIDEQDRIRPHMRLFINSFGPPVIEGYKLRFTKAGTYNYICTVHDRMKGTVIVGGG